MDAPDAINLDLRLVSGAVTTLEFEEVAAGRDGEYVPIAVALSDGTRLRLAYWRLIRPGAVINSFDHGHARGGPPINAVGELRTALAGQGCVGLRVDERTGDLLAELADGSVLVGFRFRSLFEDWEVTLSNGAAYWSNHVLV